MSSINSDVRNPASYVHPLSTRSRPPEVTAELRSIENLAPSVVLRRVSETDKERQLSKEALVSVMRAFLRSGDRDSANSVFLSLVQRVSGAIANKLRRWVSIKDSQLEDVRQTVIIGLYDYLTSLEQGEELWECNFKTCFDMRLLNILGKLNRAQPITYSVSQLTDTQGSGEQFEAPDPQAEAEFVDIEVREALTFLDNIDARLGKTFYLKFFVELQDKEIADIMEVSERTIRNWISMSRKELESFFAER